MDEFQNIYIALYTSSLSWRLMMSWAINQVWWIIINIFKIKLKREKRNNLLTIEGIRTDRLNIELPTVSLTGEIK